MTAAERRRIDKWLWYARLAKTRTMAQALAVSGRVRVNSEKNDSASRPLKTGDVLTVALESGVRVLRVRELGDRRGPASEARLLYEDLSPPATEPDSARPRAGPRPTKRDRRHLDALRPERQGDIFPRRDEGQE
ncbi:MAG TPA: RNA-binding S4 domain-containing protein [Bauldia sp.]|nr:RNA-binding S4 domain-containing protein [Bauldia sp.]